jgi:hypothetical protein
MRNVARALVRGSWLQSGCRKRYHTPSAAAGMTQALDFVHGPRRDRTCDPLIKSQAAARSVPPRRWARVGNARKRLRSRDRRRAPVGAEPGRSARSWLQSGCRNRRGTGRQ